MTRKIPLAIPYEQPRVQYTLGANPQVLYAIPWKFWTLDQDLAAVITDSFGNQRPLAWGTDFNVSGNAPADPNASYYDGGMIILNAQWPNTTLTLWRIPGLRRNFDISPTGPLNVLMLNAQLDNLTTMTQDLQLQINSDFGRSYVGLGNTFPTLVMPEPEQDMVLAWDANGNIVNVDNQSGPQGPQGPMGDPGATGPMGPQGIEGPSGTSAVIVGSFGYQTTPADLPPSGLLPANWDGPGYPGAPYQMVLGQALLYNRCPVGTPGYGDLYSYVTQVEVPAGWLDVGPVVGPPGPQGPQGPQGEPGEAWAGRPYYWLNNVGASPGVTDVGSYYHMYAPTGQFVTFQLPPLNTVPNGWWVDVQNTYASVGNVYVNAQPYTLQWCFPPGNTTMLLPGMRLKLIADTIMNIWTVADPFTVTLDATVNSPQAAGSFIAYNRGYGPGSFVATIAPFGVNGGTINGDVNFNTVNSGLSLIAAPTGQDTWTGINIGYQPGGGAWIASAMVPGVGSGFERWEMDLGDGTPETGNNAGSNFTIRNFDDSGANLGTPITIDRAQGRMTLTAPLSINGSAAAADGWAGVNLNYVVGKGSWLAAAVGSGPSSSGRWNLGLGDGAPETGGNAGSNLVLQNYDDSGNVISNVLYIYRATGVATFSNNVGATGVFQAYSDGAYATVNFNNNSGAYASAVGWLAASPQALYFSNDASSPASMLQLDGLGDLIYLGSGIAYKPGGGSWIDISDDRIKIVTGEYERGLEDILQLRPVRFTYKGNDTPTAELTRPTFRKEVPAAPHNGPAPYPASLHHHAAESGTEHVGFVAQELEAAFSDMVSQREGYIDGQKVTDLRAVDVSNLTYALVNAVKELSARVAALEGRRG